MPISTFKTVNPDDIVSTRSMLHEAIPLTGTILSGTYDRQDGTSFNIKNFSHGIFQSVYDYPYLSSSANHILDITMGYSTGSGLSGTVGASGIYRNVQAKKINTYNEMAQILVGHDENGAIRRFDEDGDLASGGRKLNEVYFINFARLLTKDEIKKGTFQITFITGGTCLQLSSGLGESGGGRNGFLTLYDGSSTTYLTNSPAGEYTLLHSSSAGTGIPYGLLYYQAGIAVISASIFHLPFPSGAGPTGRYEVDLDNYIGPNSTTTYTTSSVSASFISASISGNADSLRNRIANVQFNNTTELNSTIYFLRVHNGEFNYSSNPTYVSTSAGGGSHIRVKQNPEDEPISYICGGGLFNEYNQMVVEFKNGEVLKKTPSTEFTLRVRLDY